MSRPSAWLTGGRLLEVGLVVVSLVVVVYLVSVFVKVTTGVSRTVDSPEHIVRLQVLNGCGVQGLAGRIADRLADYGDLDLEIRIVDIDNFDIRKITKTFLISREEDRTAASLLAMKLGLDQAEIEYRPLENNYRQVSVTLVLGEDWETVGFISDDSKE